MITVWTMPDQTADQIDVQCSERDLQQFQRDETVHISILSQLRGGGRMGECCARFLCAQAVRMRTKPVVLSGDARTCRGAACASSQQSLRAKAQANFLR